MRKIAISVVVGYVLLLVPLTIPVWGLCFWKNPFKLDREIFISAFYWGFIGALAVCHMTLLCLPLRIAREKPIAKRHIWIPIVVTGFLLACLVFGVCIASAEFWKLDSHDSSSFSFPRPPPPSSGFWGSYFYPHFTLFITGFVWVLWAVVFYLYTRQRDAKSIVRLQSKWLFSSSLLGLLVAVPMHIAVRSRDVCCAGWGTFVAIAFGIPIMLMSLGPGVFFLYASRWKRLHPKKAEEIEN